MADRTKRNKRNKRKTQKKKVEPNSRFSHPKFTEAQMEEALDKGRGTVNFAMRTDTVQGQAAASIIQHR